MILQPMPMPRKQALGLYPNLQRHRNELGWSISELLAKVENPPSEKSVRRLENGQAIRLATANKLFNVVAAARNGEVKLKREEEILTVMG